MVKFIEREMKYLSHILTVILCCAPMVSVGAGPVATTSGSNLTAYNPSTAYNNQWATMSNGRYDGDTTAKVDFGNCNAVVLRCAQPKCSGGGCTDASVAGAIVSGCVKSNEKCKQYGDDLIGYMTAQLVANSNAKIQEQKNALEQAKIQAEAQAAAAAAANSQNEQMMSQMQNQMYQMQQQMAQQQEESNRQLQEALAQQAAQSAAALESMKTAATESAQQTESGITSYQQEAINRGISTDVLERQKITGQIMTEIENADLELKKVKVAMQNSFDYAKCDARGNNCSAPKRVKKWRELASDFSEPYVDTLKKIYDALMTAQGVGVDMSQIYMMLNNSCNQWGQYLCPAGTVEYPESDNTKEGPKVCSRQIDSVCLKGCTDEYSEAVTAAGWNGVAVSGKNALPVDLNQAALIVAQDKYNKCLKKCDEDRKCQKCRLLKMLTDKEEVYAGWLDTDPSVVNEQRTVVSCASGVLQASTIFSPLLSKQNDEMLVPVEQLEHWLEQVEPSTAIGKKNNNDCTCNDGDTDKYKCGLCYCKTDETGRSILEQAASKKSVKNLKQSLCVTDLGGSDANAKDECTYINPIFGICDTHPYNANVTSVDKGDGTVDTETQEQMNEIIGLKITVISQQMYKQYEYLRATLQRLKIQLEKSVLTANLEAAGGKSEDGSSSSGLLGANSNKDKTVVLAGAINCSYQVDFDRFVDCISGNVQNIIRAADGSDKKKACLQLQYDLDAVNTRLTAESKITNWTQCNGYMNNNSVKTGTTCANNDRDIIKKCANEIITKLSVAKREINNKGKSLKDLLSM